jgi:hypothetical protein
MKKLFGSHGKPGEADRKKKIVKTERKEVVESAKFRFLNQFMYENDSKKLAEHFRNRQIDFLDVRLTVPQRLPVADRRLDHQTPR